MCFFSSALKPNLPPARFELLLHPAALLGVGDVHELGADRARVDRLQLRDEIAELQALRTGERAGRELGVEVGAGEAVERGIEVGRGRTRQEAQRFEIGRRKRVLEIERIELRREMAARAVRRDELEDAGLLVRLRVADRRCGGRVGVAVEPLGLLDAVDDDRMWDVAGLAAFQRVENRAPAGRYGRRIEQVFLVQLFDEGGIAARERGSRFKLFEKVRAHSHTIETKRRASARRVSTSEHARRRPGKSLGL